MSLAEIKAEIAGMLSGELREFTVWFENFLADAWDRQIEADTKAGRLNAAAKQADDDFEAGRCTPLRWAGDR